MPTPRETFEEALCLVKEIARGVDRLSSTPVETGVELGRALQRLSALARDPHDDWVDRILNWEQWRLLAPAVRRARARYELDRERAEAATLLARGTEVDFRGRLSSVYEGSAIFAPEFMKVTGALNRALVVGSGPMPDTAAMLALFCRLQVTCLDIDPTILATSPAILTLAGVTDPVEHIIVDAVRFANYERYDLVFVNALALPVIDGGEDPKVQLAASIKSSAVSGTIVAIREGHGIGRLYYPSAGGASHHLTSLTTIRPSKPDRGALALFEA